MSTTAPVRDPWISPLGYTYVKDETQNVYDAALNRIREIVQGKPFCVSFSGGKDSTCTMMLALQVAREMNHLPLIVISVDEEVIDPDTIAYLERARAMPDIDFHWFCLPIRHTLRSQTRTCWYPWDPDYRDVWARQPPPWAITEQEGFVKGTMGIQNICETLMQSKYPGQEYVNLVGIRIEESLNRRRAIINSGTYIAMKGRYCHYVKPIFDWTVQDVWRAILVNGWDHSRYYDRMWMSGIPLSGQRIAPWGNVAAVREARFYPEFYPDFWEKAIRRLPELRAMQRYGTTSLYRKAMAKPSHLTWQQYCYVLIEQLEDEKARKFWYHTIAKRMRRWARDSSVPFPDEQLRGAAKLTCWKRMASSIAKNDLTYLDGGSFGSRDNL